MDAYSSYIVRLSEARLDELRREAAEYALSRASQDGRASRWARLRVRFGRRARPAPEPVAPVPLPRPAPETELRRSA